MTIEFQVDSNTTLPNGNQSAAIKSLDGSCLGNVIGLGLTVGNLYNMTVEDVTSTGGTHPQGPIG